MERFGSVLVTFITFQDTNGAPLVIEGLHVSVTLPDDETTLLDNEIFIGCL